MKEHFDNFDLKITFLLLFFINLSVYTLNGQERYTNTEIDLKIELSQKDINQTQEKINDFRREMDNYKSDYEYRAQQQDDKIANRNDFISIFLAAFSILLALGIALAGYLSYRKVKRDTQKEIQKELSGIQQLKEEVEKKSKEIMDGINDKEQEANEKLKHIKELDEQGEKLVESSRKQSLEKPTLDEKTKQELLEYVREINKTKSDEELTANDWFLKGRNVFDEAESLTNKFQKEIKFREAIHYYQKSVELDPDNADPFNSWGYTLVLLGEIKQSETLYRESIDLFTEAARLNPKNDTIVNNLGVALDYLAKLKQDETMFKESLEKFAETVRLNPKNDSAFNNWGWAFIELGKLTNNQKLFKESINKLKKAVELCPNSTTEYHMTRSYSLLNEKESAFNWLEKYLQSSNTKFDRNYIENDSDLNTIKDDPKFKELLNKYLPKN